MNAAPDAQYAVNLRVYHAPGVERAYTSRELTRVEVVALLKHHAAFADRDVLDLGVGTGRTSIYLAPLARRYEAIDYSPVMVDYLRARMPEISVRTADMRDLSVFTDATFDFVFATNNVVDAVGHDDRLRSLREVRRVLRPGGVLMFSSHNREYRHALSGPRLRWSRNPSTEVRYLRQWLRQLANHARVGALREQNADYALLDDPGHDYACLHYYISQAMQRRQLDSLGFEVLDVFDTEGRAATPGAPAADSASLMYVSRYVSRA
jgi:SAM-dependent methyltransferase